MLQKSNNSLLVDVRCYLRGTGPVTTETWTLICVRVTAITSTGEHL